MRRASHSVTIHARERPSINRHTENFRELRFTPQNLGPSPPASTALAQPALTPPSAMSSLKNLVKTRTYRERSQPKARAKLGMLEKHKDYKLRAVDFHRKEDALKKMKEKAALKNPDEFYFNMVRTKQVLPIRPPRPHAAAARMLRRRRLMPLRRVRR